MIAARMTSRRFPKCSYLSRIEEELIDQLFNSSERRLARLLLLLANFGKDGSPIDDQSKYQPGNPGGDDRHDPVPRQLLPEQIRKMGLISYNGKIEVDTALLHDKPEIQDNE
jgi:CRP/FNR family cyclic AMP-dependent transcriptional regulator